MRYLDDDLLNRIEEQSRRRLSRRGLIARSLKVGAGGALAVALSGSALQSAVAQDTDGETDAAEDEEEATDDAATDEAAEDDEEDEGIGGGGRTETEGVGGGGTTDSAAAAPAAGGDLPSTGAGPLGGSSHMPEVIGAVALGAAAAAALTYRQANAKTSTDA